MHLRSGFDADEKEIWVKARCSAPWCSRCEGLRCSAIKRKINQYLDYHNPPHLWFVTRSVRNDLSLKRAFDDLHHVNHNFVTQKDKSATHPWHSNAEFWIGTYEITWTRQKGYNVHQHLIVGSTNDYMDYTDLKKRWSQAAGYPAHFDVTKIEHGIVGAIRYLSGYLGNGLKGSWGGLDLNRAYREHRTLFKRNRIVTKRGTVPPQSRAGFRICCMSPESVCNRH